MPVTLDLRVTVSDADYPRLIAAARNTFKDEIPQGASDDAIIELLRQYGIQQMRSIVYTYERMLAMKSAEALNPSIEVS